MGNERDYSCSECLFSELLAEVTSVMEISRRLPHLPFRATAGKVDVCQYDNILGGEFAEVLRALADTHGDETITLVTLEPDPFAYYLRHFQNWPGFRIATDDLLDGYWRFLAHEPGGDPTGAIKYTANVVTLVGSTRTWSVWGQRDWDLALVHSQAEERPWLDGDVPFVSAREALSTFTEPPGFTPLTASERSIFLTSMDGMAES